MSATSESAAVCARPEDFLRVFDASCGLIQLVAGDDLMVQEGNDVEVETGDGDQDDDDEEEDETTRIARLVAVIAREHAYCTTPITTVREEPPVPVVAPVIIAAVMPVTAEPPVEPVTAVATPKVVSRLSTAAADSGSDSATASPVRRSRRQQEKLEREQAKVETVEPEAPKLSVTAAERSPAPPPPPKVVSIVPKVEVPPPPVEQMAEEPAPEVKVSPPSPKVEVPVIPVVVEQPPEPQISPLAATLYAAASDERFKIRAPPELPAEIMACDVAPEPIAAPLEPRVFVRALDSLPVDYIPSSVMADQAMAAPPPPQPEEPLPDPHTITSNLIGADDAALLLAAVAAATAPLAVGRPVSSETLADGTPAGVGQHRRSRELSLEEIDDGFGRVVQRRPSGGSKKTDVKVHFEVPSKESPTSPGRKASSTRKSYPKRENRKPPAHLMDMFDPPLFSKPDRMKKIDSKSDEDDGGEHSDVAADVGDTPVAETRSLPKKSTEDIEDYLSRVDGASEDADQLKAVEAATVRPSKTSVISEADVKKTTELALKSSATKRPNRKPMPSRKGEFRRNRKDKKRRMALNRGNKEAKSGNLSDSSSSNGSSSATDSDWCSEDDPDRLWCICNQPHNDRFMISCDKCEDWYHGTCVGVSRKQGREWEKNGQEWTCPKCVRAKEQLKEKRPDPRMTGKSPPKLPEKAEAKIGVTPAHSPVKTATAPKPAPPPVREKEKLKILGSPTKDRPPPPRLKEVARVAPRTVELDARLAPRLAELDPRLTQLVRTLSADAAIASKDRVVASSVQSPPPPTPVQHTATEAAPDVERAQLCVVGCGRTARPDSIFCGNECILQHADEAVKVVSKEKEKEKERKLVLMKSVIKPEIKREVTADQILAIDKTTGKVVPGPTAFGSAHLREWLRQHPNVQLVKARDKKEPTTPTVAGAATVQRDISQRKFYGSPQKTIKLISAQQMLPVENSAEKKTPARVQSAVAEKKETPTTPAILKKTVPEPRRLSAEIKSKAATVSVPRTPEPKKRLSSSSQGPTAAAAQTQPPTQSGPEPIRESVLKSLREILSSRNTEIEVDPLTAEEVKKVADSIEEELFKLFSDVGMKYKSKYRSLIFNIKDSRNHGLYQKILRGKISPFKLVRMTPEELASKELAMWREREAKHTLEMIKREQEEQKHVPIIKKTHKGEIEIDDTDLGFSEKPKPKVEFVPTIDAILTPQEDTTDSHRSHLFDLNCKICTGQMLAPTDVADPSAKKARVATSISMESRSQDEESDDEGKATASKEDESAKKNSKEEPARRSVRTEAKDKQKEKDQRGKDDKEKDRHSSSLRKGSTSKPEMERTRSKERDKSKDGGKSKDCSKTKDRDNSKVDNRSKEKDKSLSTDKSKEREKDKSKTSAKDQSSRPKEGDKKKTAEKTSASRNESESKGGDKSKDDQSKGTKRSSSAIAQPNDQSKKPKKSKIEGTGLTVPLKTSDDREPSSTVTIGSPDSAVTSQTDVDGSKSSQSSVWKGFITMQDVAKFVTSAYKVSGPTDFLAQDIPDTIQVCGRIAPHTVWDYLNKVKQSGNKEFLVIRFNPANEEENVSFGLFYTYLNSRNRFGVVGNCSKVIKDFYILPLGSDVPIPETLLPFEYFDGLDESRTDTLLGVIIRHKGKRKDGPTNGKASKSSKKARLAAAKSNAAAVEEDVSGDSKGSDTVTSAKRVKFNLKVKSSLPSAEEDDTPYEPSYTPPLEDMQSRPTGDPSSSPYDPSYTPPLRDSGKATEGDDSPYSPGQATTGGGADDGDQPYDPEEGHGTTAVPSIIPGLLAGSVSSQSVSDLIDHISMSSNPTASASSVLASIATATNLEQQRQLLIELTQKVEEQKMQLEKQKQQIATKVTAQVMGAMATVPSFTAALASSATTAVAAAAAAASLAASTMSPAPPLAPAALSSPVRATTSGEPDSSRDSPYEPADEDEPTYTPSYTPPMGSADDDGDKKTSKTSDSQLRSSTTLQITDTSSISLPPNLQEILESIKKQAASSSTSDQEQSATPAAVKPPAPTTILDDPIVRSYSQAVDEVEEAGTPPHDSPTAAAPPTKQSDPRLGRPKMSAVRHDPRRKVQAPTSAVINTATTDAEKKTSELGSLSASQLLEKAMRQLSDMSGDVAPSVANATVSTPVEIFSPSTPHESAASSVTASAPAPLRSSLPVISSTGAEEEPPPPGMEMNLSLASIPVPSLAGPSTLPPPPASTMPYAMPPPNMYGHMGVAPTTGNPLGIPNFSIPPPSFIQPPGYMTYSQYQQPPPQSAPPPPLPFPPQQHGTGGNGGYWQSGAVSQDWHGGNNASGPANYRDRGGRWEGGGNGGGRGRHDFNAEGGDQTESWPSRRGGGDRRQFDRRNDRRDDRHQDYRKGRNQGRDNQGRDNQGRDNQGRDNQGRDNQGRDNRGPRNRDRSRSRERDRQHGRYRDKGRTWERGRDRERERSWDRERETSRDRERTRDDDRSGSKDRDRSKSKDRERSRSRDRGHSRSSRDQDRSPSRNRDRSRSRERNRSGSRDRNRSMSRDRDRSRSKDHDRSRSRDRERSKSKDRDRQASRDRDSPTNKDRDRLPSRDRDSPADRECDRSTKKDSDGLASRDSEHLKSQDYVGDPIMEDVRSAKEDGEKEQNSNCEIVLKEDRFGSPITAETFGEVTESAEKEGDQT